MVSALSNSKAVETPNRVWFFNAPVDLVCCCGGLLWFVVGIHSWLVFPYHKQVLLFSPESTPVEKVLFLLLYAAAYLVSFPHTIAPLVRLYGGRENFNKYRFGAIFTPIAVAALLVAAVSQPWLIPWYVRVSIIWNIHHWIAQSYGIGMIYFGRAGIKLGTLDRKLLWGACQLLFFWAMAKILAFPENQPRDYQGIPVAPTIMLSQEFCAVVEKVCLTGGAAIAIWLAIEWSRKRLVPPLPVVLLYATIFRITTSSFNYNVDLWFYGLPLFHALQYLVVTARYHANERGIFADGEFPVWAELIRSKDMRNYYLGLLIVSSTLYVGLPLFLQACGVAATNSLALTFLLLNFQHIVADSFIWRLKDPGVRRYL